MINVFAVIGLGIKVLTKESGVQLLSDAKIFYPYWAPFKAGTLNFSALHKAGKLRPLISALKRTIDTLDAVLNDKEADAEFAQLLESLDPV